MYEYVSPLSTRFASKNDVCIVLLYSIRVRTNFFVISGTHHTPPKSVRIAVEVRLSVGTDSVLQNITLLNKLFSHSSNFVLFYVFLLL
jgi:hypothetical protein